MSSWIVCLFLAPLTADAGWDTPTAAARSASLVRSFPEANRSPVVVSPRGTSEVGPPPRQLPPPSGGGSTSGQTGRPASSGRAFTTVVGSLAVVLGAFFLVAWATRRAAPRRFQLLPPEVVDCLGRAPLAGRQQLQLMRLGKKLVLLSVTATDARALCEVTDPAEVDRIAGLCQQTRPESVTTSFRQALAQCATESVPRSTPTATGAAIAGRVPRSDVRVLHQQRGA